MKAQDYLRQLKDLKTKIKNKESEREFWKSVALNTTARIGGERVMSSGSHQPMANASDQGVDIDREIDSLKAELYAKAQEVLKTIEQIRGVQYDVLHMIYFQNMDLCDVAAFYKKSYSWATTVHGRALKNVQRIIDGRADS